MFQRDLRQLPIFSCQPRSLCLLAALLLALPAAASAADTESILNAKWRGGFVVARLPLASDCNSFYNDNDVRGAQIDSSARRRFKPGEMARVERIGVKRGRVDVFLDLSEGVLDETHDGPFTLYEPKTCKVQLKVPVPDSKDTPKVEDRLAELLELHPGDREAMASSAWNGRRREPLPKDYEKTLAAHAAWKAAETHSAVQTRIGQAIEEAARIADHVHSEPDYMAGFGAGLEKERDRSFASCESALGSSFIPYSSGGRGKSHDWDRGNEDGQRLAYQLALLRALKDCVLPASR
ncbi:MAG TPA: hypothetical protein VFE33_31735 [Thermoanaerobaculia bacterium]|nr:hypothetical protein [Thermoanaerobaculia bacterium]